MRQQRFHFQLKNGTGKWGNSTESSIVGRTGGLLLANKVNETMRVTEKDIVFATSTFSLCELVALRPAFQNAKKVWVVRIPS